MMTRSHLKKRSNSPSWRSGDDGANYHNEAGDDEATDGDDGKLLEKEKQFSQLEVRSHFELISIDCEKS